MECSTRNFNLQSSNLGIALCRISTMSFFFFHLILVPSVTPVSFTFDSFNLSNPDMKYEGDAFQSNGVIQLTKDEAYRNLNYCSGRAIYGDPVRIWDRATLGLADFTTHFSFSIDTLHQSDHGDGLAFFLAANKSLPSNSAGSCLGLVNCDNGLNTSHDPYVAVEFDTFPNTWDPNYDHIGINLNSLESVETVGWRCESKARNKARVSYDSSTKNFSVFLSYDDSPTAYSSAFYHVDLRDYLPEWVTIGFSASTGAVFQIHSVLDWDFQSSLGAVESQQNRIVLEVRKDGIYADTPQYGTGTVTNGTSQERGQPYAKGQPYNPRAIPPPAIPSPPPPYLIPRAIPPPAIPSPPPLYLTAPAIPQNGTSQVIPRNGTVAERGRNRTVAIIPQNGTVTESGRNETVPVGVPKKKKNKWVVLVSCVVVVLLGGFGLIWFLWRKKRSGSNERYNGLTSDELEQRKNQEMVSSIAVHGKILETNGGMPLAIEDPTPKITIPASNIEQEQYAGTREMASSSGFHVTIDEMRPTSQNSMVPPASGTTGIVFPKEFSCRELVDATDNFKEEIGKGGFGQVFKGFLGDHNLEVAVKKFSKGAHDRGVKQFESEVKTLSRLRHGNLVQLYGWCNEEKELLLVYEFMPNGSLWDRLFKEKRLLAWKERYKIVQDLASGLLYLHEEGASYIIHRDIKSCNVLLDVAFKAKLGDFGLARLVEEGEDPLTTYIAGTMGYVAPECELRQKPSKQSDVYSFGIVALEIGTGKKSIEFVDNLQLVQWVWMQYGEGNVLGAADPRLCKEFDENEMNCLLVVGLWCAHPDPISRPTIGEANNMLLQKAPLPPIPEEMPFISGHGRSNDHPPVKVDGFSSSGKSYKTAPSGASQ